MSPPLGLRHRLWEGNWLHRGEPWPTENTGRSPSSRHLPGKVGSRPSLRWGRGAPRRTPTRLPLPSASSRPPAVPLLWKETETATKVLSRYMKSLTTANPKLNAEAASLDGARGPGGSFGLLCGDPEEERRGCVRKHNTTTDKTTRWSVRIPGKVRQSGTRG